MMEIKIEIPKELEEEIRKLGKDEINRIVYEALKEKASERLLFKLADKILENSKLNDEQIEELSNIVKERVAEKHGIK